MKIYKRITLLTSVVFGTLAFAQTLSVEGVNYEVDMETKEAMVISTPGAQGIIEISSSVIYEGERYLVTEIGDAAFFQQPVSQVVIPETVKVIGEGAFFGTAIQNVIIPESVTTIKTAAFCTSSLQRVDIPSSVTSIGEDSFSFTEIVGVSIHENLESIGNGAFRNIPLSSFITSSTTPLAINVNVFDDISLFEAVLIVPEGAEEAYREASVWKDFGQVGFTHTLNKEGINYEINSISKEATVVNSPSAEGEIEILRMVSYNDEIYDVTVVGEAAFLQLPIIEVVIPDSIASIESGAFFGTLIKEVNIPDSIINIGAAAFCTSTLERVEIPFSVISIGEDSFSFTRITDVKIHSNLQSIGRGAFRNTLLSNFTTTNKSPIEIEANIFDNIDLSKAELIVPEGEEKKYEKANVWGDFGMITQSAILSRANYDIEYNSFEVTQNEDELEVQGENIDGLSLYAISGELLLKTSTSRISKRGLAVGVYVLLVAKEKVNVSKKIILN